MKKTTLNRKVVTTLFTAILFILLIVPSIILPGLATATYNKELEQPFAGTDVNRFIDRVHPSTNVLVSAHLQQFQVTSEFTLGKIILQLNNAPTSYSAVMEIYPVTSGNTINGAMLEQATAATSMTFTFNGTTTLSPGYYAFQVYVTALSSGLEIKADSDGTLGIDTPYVNYGYGNNIPGSLCTEIYSIQPEGYDLTITSDEHTTTNPTPGTYTITAGNSQQVNYTAATGYHILSVLIDDIESVNTYPSTYTFTNMQTSHTIAVTSEADPEPTPTPTPTPTQSWTDITLPYKITSPGNYRITNSTIVDDADASTNFAALSINASNVFFDGQNYQITLNGTTTDGITIGSGANTVTIQNYCATTTEAIDNFIEASDNNDGLTITNCTLNANEGHSPTGIAILTAGGASDNVNITNVNMYNTAAYGIIFTNDFPSPSTGLTISNVHIESPNYGIGIKIVGILADFLIEDSYINCGYDGVWVADDSHDFIIDNITVVGSNDYGGFYDGTDAYNYTVRNSEFRNCTTDNIFAGGQNFTFSNVTSTGSTYDGFDIYGSTNAIVTDSVSSGNSLGIDVSFATGFTLYNNLWNNTENVVSSSSNGDFNVTRQLGARVYSEGPYIGGNFWAFPNGTGYSQTETDTNHDGFIDTSYDILGDGSLIDYLPYSLDYAPPTQPVTTLKPNLYFRSDTYTTLGVSAYGLDNDYTNTYANITSSYGTSQSVYYGFRVWLVNSATSEAELTSGSPIATIGIGSNVTGSVAATWSFPGNDITLGYQALKVIMYQSTDNTTWTARATYISPVLITDEIRQTTWTFILNVAYTNNGSATNSTVFFGDNQHKSGIMGIVFEKPAESQVQMWRFSMGDILGFVIGGYYDIIGPAFYALILFGFFYSLYRRYGHVGPMLVTFVLFAGPGSILLILIPAWAIIPTALILILSGTFILWRIIR